MNGYKRAALAAIGVIAGSTLGMASAGATTHSYGGCVWNGFAFPSAGDSIADDGANDCANVRARITVYVGPGSTYSYGPIDPAYSKAHVNSGYLTGSSAAQCANCSPSWSSYLVN